jgi:hypothetical protein
MSGNFNAVSGADRRQHARRSPSATLKGKYTANEGTRKWYNPNFDHLEFSNNKINLFGIRANLCEESIELL